MLTVKNLQANIANQSILKGIDLAIQAGEVHVIMGPNGSGKSTLTKVLAGCPGYDVTEGEVRFEGQDLLAQPIETRAAMGLFLAFQYPVEIPGVNNVYFLKTALNILREQRGEQRLDAVEFLDLVKKKLQTVGLNETFLQRGVNDGFSGGEKKRNEVLQMLLLQPKLAMLDETDSGLDIDALQMIAKAVNQLRDGQRSFLIVTHYQRLLDYIVPDYVHVLAQGRIVKSGDKTLALTLEREGYAWIQEEADQILE